MFTDFPRHKRESERESERERERERVLFGDESSLLYSLPLSEQPLAFHRMSGNGEAVSAGQCAMEVLYAKYLQQEL